MVLSRSAQPFVKKNPTLMIILQGSSHYIGSRYCYVGKYTCPGPVRSKKWFLLCCQLYHHSHVISDVRYIFFILNQPFWNPTSAETNDDDFHTEADVMRLKLTGVWSLARLLDGMDGRDSVKRFVCHLIYYVETL